MHRQKAIIWGCGVQGKIAYHKLNLDFDIIAFTDNNASLHGEVLIGVPIIAPNEIKKLPEALIFVCIVSGFISVAQQLETLGFPCIIWRGGLCYDYRDTLLHPVTFNSSPPYQKAAKSDFSVLYVQDTACGRTDKISYAVKAAGVVTHNAYLRHPSRMPEAYNAELSFYSYNDLLEYVNKSDYDIIHCSNEPDILTNLLLHSNKKIVYDSHDVLTARNNDTSQERYFLEYTANKFADGNMYVGAYYRDLQVERYHFSPEKTFIIPNMALECQLPESIHQKAKLSETDGELHVVYQGGLSDNPLSNRYLEDIWSALTASKVHVHFYSQQSLNYCLKLEKKSPFLHYEGDLSGLELITQMTQYDIGLLLLNSTDKNAQMAYPNKLYEYIAARLPIVSNLFTSTTFCVERGLGGELDLNGDIALQLREYTKIKIPENYLKMNKLTMDSHADDIIAFYRKIHAKD